MMREKIVLDKYFNITVLNENIIIFSKTPRHMSVLHNRRKKCKKCTISGAGSKEREKSGLTRFILLQEVNRGREGQCADTF